MKKSALVHELLYLKVKAIRIWHLEITIFISNNNFIINTIVYILLRLHFITFTIFNKIYMIYNIFFIFGGYEK